MEEFIAMCDAADELKEIWNPQPGDKYYLKNDLYAVDHGEKGLSLTPADDPEPYFKEGIYFIGTERDFGEVLFHDMVYYFPETMKKHSIWLPSQKDMQNLLQRTMITNSSLIINFKNFTFSYGRINKYSLDELWVMFYYFDTHSKIWNGEEFEKVYKDLIGVWS